MMFIVTNIMDNLVTIIDKLDIGQVFYIIVSLFEWIFMINLKSPVVLSW